MDVQTLGKREAFLDLNPVVQVQESEYKRLLGYPQDVQLDERPVELMQISREWYERNGKPWMYVHPLSPVELGDDEFVIEGIRFKSRRVLENFRQAGVHAAILVAVSAGKGCEAYAAELWREEKPDEYFFMEMYGSAVVESLVMQTGAKICEWASESQAAAIPHYSPGYPEWDIREQYNLFSLIKQGGKLPDELGVLESGMLNPKKSLLAVFGITNHTEKVAQWSQLIPCTNCSLASCAYRRKPYSRLKASAGVSSESNGNRLEQKYTINKRALEKWTSERLKLSSGDDGTIHASFRYEGTTCSNMGRTLLFDYNLHLQPSDDGFIIAEASCGPAPEDTGHTAMCQYLKNGQELMRTITSEKPLLGKSLDDVFSWEDFKFNPSGCYCTKPARDHKWGIVLEVVHYALSHGKQPS